MNKTLSLQRITCLYLKIFLLIILTCMSIKAQAVVEYSKITISFNNESFVQAFKVIRHQTNLRFTYSNDQFDESKKVTLVATNQPLNKILDQMLSGTGYNWSIEDSMVIIRKKNKNGQIRNVNYSNVEDSLVNITGLVLDEKRKPIPGVSISIKGSTIGVTTNEAGQFTFRNIPYRSYLSFSSIGFLPQQIKAEVFLIQKMVILKEAVNILDAAVVEAYSITSKRYSTSSIGTVTSKDIEKRPISNPLLALQAIVPGIIVQQSSGVANAGISVQIRGQNSFLQGGDPLYVIDGVPYTSQLLQANNLSLGTSGDPTKIDYVRQGNPMSFINPADIESISVLKDADATSIYGSRAAAGAILITTKKGAAGPTRFNINMQQGWGKVSRFMDLLNKDQYMLMRHEAKVNSNQAILPTDYDLNGTWDTTRSTDWQKTLLGGTAKFADYQISTSGGTENTKFLIGAGYHRETSVFLADVVDKKGSLHFNISNISSNKKFRLQLSGSYMADDNRPIVSSLSLSALTLPPVAPALFNKDGSLNWAQNSAGQSTWTNPLATNGSFANIKTNNLVSSLQVSYDLASGLTLRSNFGYTNMGIDEIGTLPVSIYAPELQASMNRRATYGNGSIKSWIIEPQINYNLNFGNDNLLDVIIGSTLQTQNSDQHMFQGNGYSTDQLLKDPGAASSLQYLSTTASVYKYNALFGRINYRLKSRYMINISARRDGSSRFGPRNLFHNFASIGAAWIFSEESFFNRLLPVINFGKFQTSYGTTGNDQIGDYKFLNIYYSDVMQVPYQGIVGLTSAGLSNPYLQWEETRKLQFSIDLGFLHNRIFANATYFRNRSSNQLMGYSLPSFTGFGGYTTNFPATIQNMGWEFSINSDNIKSKDFNWSTKVNFYIPRNKLVSFPNIENTPYANSFIIGQPITIKRVYKFAGVDTQTGLYQFYDYKGNLTSSPKSSTDMIMLNTNSTYSGGLSNSFNWRAFSLDVLLQYSKRYVTNLQLGNILPGAMINQPLAVLNRWRKTGDVASGQKFVSNRPSNVFNAYLKAFTSDARYTNSDLFRVKNVSISWKVPPNWCHQAKIQSCQVYIHADNLFTFTNFKGADPETGTGASLPPLRMITCGLQLLL